MAASHTMVSAPVSGSRSSGPITLWKPGSDVTTPGVSAQPGCMVCTAMPSAAQRSCISGVSATCIRFVRAYAAVPAYSPSVNSGSWTGIRCAYIPPEDTTTTRDVPAAASTGRSSSVSSTGPSTCVA